jgi:hypothetical protein
MRIAGTAILMFTVMLGCEDRSSSSPTAPQRTAGNEPQHKGDPELNKWLLDAIEAHQIAASIDGEWVAPQGSGVRVNAECVSDNSKATGTIVELNLRLALPDGRVVVQQVVGVGNNRSEAIANAEASFLLGTLHVWLAAFIDPAEEHVERLELTIGGRKRIVTLGNVLTKAAGELPKDDLKWKDQLLKTIERAELTRGAHWVDVYNGIVQKGKAQEMEIQLDHVRWTAMEEQMRSAPWPDNGQFTSVRLFLVIQDENDPTRPTTRPTTRASTRPSTARAL